MEWYNLALLCALISAGGAILLKKVLFKERSFEFNVVAKLFQAALILILIPFLDLNVPLWVMLSVYAISIFAVIYITLETKAYRHLELSAVVPLSNLGPAVLLIFAFLLLGERITILQGVGILTLVVGAYFLEANHHWRDVKGVFNSLKSKYVVYFFIGLVLSTFVHLGNKYFINIGISILSLAFLYYIFTSLNFTLVSFIFFDGFKGIKHGIKTQGFLIFLIALAYVAHRLIFLKAITLANVSLVMPIAHTGILLSTFIGGELFHEKHVWQRSFSCIIMIIGAYLVIIG